MAREPRRIVTGHDAEGKSVIVIDGPPTPFGAYWLTDTTPVDNASSGDAGMQVRKLEPPPGGSIFRFAAIPPEDPKVSREERERQTAKMFAQMDAAHCRSDTSRHPGMHKTRTIDYICCSRARSRCYSTKAKSISSRSMSSCSAGQITHGSTRASSRR